LGPAPSACPGEPCPTRSSRRSTASTGYWRTCGSRHEVAVAAELAGLDPAAAELVADDLAAAQILAAARPLDFVLPLIGEAIYDAIATGRRRLDHRRAAAILDRIGAADSVAAHLLLTGPASDKWVERP
jgi:hypothetical protein